MLPCKFLSNTPGDAHCRRTRRSRPSLLLTLDSLRRGMAPIAHVLWDKFMKFNPKNPKWLNRDRFVLS